MKKIKPYHIGLNGKIRNDFFEINADSIPILDGWGWSDYWSVNDWIDWHKANVKKYGLNVANEKLIREYHKATMFAASYDWRTFNPTFIKYAKENGFYNALYSGLGGLLAKPLGSAVNVVNKAAEVVNTGSDKAASILNFSINNILLIVVLILVVSYFLKSKLN
jgi:hypothetical protein